MTAPELQHQHALCTFYLNGMLFGVPVTDVQEVIMPQRITRVPQAPPVVHGLINLRGQIITAIDLRGRLELPPPASTVQSMNVVVRTESEAVSLLVDDIGDVVDVPENVFEVSPETVPRSMRELIRGVYKLQSMLLIVLDTEKTVSLNPFRGDHP